LPRPEGNLLQLCTVGVEYASAEYGLETGPYATDLDGIVYDVVRSRLSYDDGWKSRASASFCCRKPARISDLIYYLVTTLVDDDEF
jgi:hypothetical protein